MLKVNGKFAIELSTNTAKKTMALANIDGQPDIPMMMVSIMNVKHTPESLTVDFKIPYNNELIGIGSYTLSLSGQLNQFSELCVLKHLSKGSVVVLSTTVNNVPTRRGSIILEFTLLKSELNQQYHIN